MIENLLGSRCISARRLQHRFADHSAGKLGPLELGWANGEFTTLDANADWTLDVSFRPWIDPFKRASDKDRQRLSFELGLWEAVDLPEELHALIGRTVTDVRPIMNEVGELSGLEIEFGGGLHLHAKTYEGDLVINVES